MERSVVEYFSEHAAYKCGYCSSTNTCYSHGMWAHTLTPMDYQNLIDRGWRRSGKYCYKPEMKKTCCPLYTIRCEAKKFTLSKSQKKCLKRMNKFLADGIKEKTKTPTACDVREQEMDVVSEYSLEYDAQYVEKNKKCGSLKDLMNDCSSDNCQVAESSMSAKVGENSCLNIPVPVEPSQVCDASSDTFINPDASVRAPCRKAKLIRQERKVQKLLKMGKTQEEALASVKKKPNAAKSLEDFLKQEHPEKLAHKLELRLVPSGPENNSFKSSFEESYLLYSKYQAIIHDDKKCTPKQFERFLITNPFKVYSDASKQTYGSFHQQYWLDDKLIAVAVLDILPYCVSSVYFYYDPDYSFLSLGTYAALREVALSRKLSEKYDDLQYYYMGFYLHSCVKMRYKGHFTPSYLLCPETYIFQPIEKCRPKFDASKYQRLDEDYKQEDMNGQVEMRDVLCLFKRRPVRYETYCHLKKNADDQEEIEEYAKLVGKLCYSNLLLYRS